MAVQVADGRVFWCEGQSGVEFRPRGIETAEVGIRDVRHKGGSSSGRMSRVGEGGGEEEGVGAAERLV